MKHIFLTISVFLLTLPKIAAEAPLFPYPEAPETLETMTERCSYVVEHFWDRCNINQAFSARGKLQKAFNDYIQLIPYAEAGVVHQSVDKLIEKVQKNPSNMLTLAEMAEGLMYSDTAHIVCDEVYLPFARAVANHKKIKSAEKERFIAQTIILEGSQVGMIAPDIVLTTTDGSKQKLSELPAGYVILFFNDPDCSDCLMARVRLAADYNINEFIKKGQLQVVSVYPGDPSDEEWKESAKRLPENWVIGACADADRVYDMRNPPVIYYLNSRHKILSKSMTVDQLINAFRQINTRTAGE